MKKKVESNYKIKQCLCGKATSMTNETNQPDETLFSQKQKLLILKFIETSHEEQQGNISNK